MTDEKEGKGKHLKGKAKEKAGEMLGDREMEQEGELEQREGRAEQDADRAEKRAREARARKARAEIEREKKDR